MGLLLKAFVALDLLLFASGGAEAFLAGSAPGGLPWGAASLASLSIGAALAAALAAPLRADADSRWSEPPPAARPWDKAP